MLALTPDQTNALIAIKRARDLRAIADRLSAAFPDVAARAAERLPALIEHGVQRGASWGLTHAVCVARYLACWFMFGAEFETKPEFAWAREMLGPGRTEGGKVFQLCRRVRELLARPQQGQLGSAEFEAALLQLDSALMERGRIGSLLAPETIKLGEPCDIDAFDLRATGAAAQLYRQEQGQWRPSPGAESVPVTGAGPACLPPAVHVLSPSLRVRSRAEHVCDTATHPLIAHAGDQGLHNWRGKDAAEVTIHVSALPVPEGLGAEGGPAWTLLTAAGCGLRENGEPFGEQQTRIAAYPATQQLLAWRRDKGAAARALLERDGQAQDAARWTAGLADLDKQLNEGLARLRTAWERESGVTSASMEADPQVFTGTAALTWGWAAGTDLAQPPLFRIAGALDLVACELKLRLGGLLTLAGSQSRIALHVSGGEKLVGNFERRNAEQDIAAALAPAQCKFRQPLVLHLESLANAEQPALLDQTGPVAGAIVGACGLRLRADGPGLEWFCEIAVEPASVRLTVNDPLLGQQTQVRSLLPAMKLVNWSLA